MSCWHISLFLNWDENICRAFALSLSWLLLQSSILFFCRSTFFGNPLIQLLCYSAVVNVPWFSKEHHDCCFCITSRTYLLPLWWKLASSSVSAQVCFISLSFCASLMMEYFANCSQIKLSPRNFEVQRTLIRYWRHELGEEFIYKGRKETYHQHAMKSIHCQMLYRFLIKSSSDHLFWIRQLPIRNCRVEFELSFKVEME